jgi:hypothetical protein
MKEVSMDNRIPISFPMSFSPERNYLYKILEVASMTPEPMNLHELHEITGIPMGKITGKVKPHLDYSKGMGLIEYKTISGKYLLSLTNFGKIAFQNDSLLSEALTQWIAHANLCDPTEGAEVWFRIFTQWDNAQETKTIDDLARECDIQIQATKLTISMYEKQEAFLFSHVLTRYDENPIALKRLSAPIGQEFDRAYGALLVSLMSRYFPNRDQVSIEEFNVLTKFSSRFCWNEELLALVLDHTARNGIIKISSLVHPSVIQVLCSEQEAWENIYDDLR